jgi:phage/plasmid-like protein (TIGR03299 family)
MKIGKLADKPMTAAEAAEAGGLNFEVIKAELSWTSDEHKTSGTVDDRVAVVRKDSWTPLGIMSKSYPLLQFGEAFDFMDTVNSRYVAAGCLKGGRQGFMVVKLPEKLNVLGGDDPHELFGVLRTSHDGSRAVEFMIMPLRDRCMNQLTLNSFSAGVPHRWSIKHTSTMAAKLQEARASLENVDKYAKRFEENARRLVKIKLSEDVARSTLEAVLPNRPRRDEQVERIITSWHTAETVGFDWTGWGLVNAVSEYFDWGRTGGSPESRFVGALQGQTTNMINRVAGRILTRAS